MPELPEVTTTVNGLQNALPGVGIVDVWTDLAVKNQKHKQFRETIKDLDFFISFKKLVIGQKILTVERRAKNILINLSNKQTILIHLKMTGHIMIGFYDYNQKKNIWAPHEKEKNLALRNPYNRFIHFVMTLNNGKHLAFCDARKFGKVTLIPTKDIHSLDHLGVIGPEPLAKEFTFTQFISRINTKGSGKIKTVLMDQAVIAGIGNIYSDEMLWLAGINPEQTVRTISKEKMKLLFSSMKKVLLKGIEFGGDSTSDYRDINGRPGKFHHAHNVYRKTGEKCGKRGCPGIIIRKVVGARSAHFCSVHQAVVKS
jgi:formamidopyrimidine-DNA glycosylase